MATLTYSFESAQTNIVVERGGLAMVDRYVQDSSTKNINCQFVFVISDETVGGLYGSTVIDALERGGRRCRQCIIPSGEDGKSLAVLERVYSALAQSGMNRSGAILALGGGAVTDLAGFAAATWMRGVTLILCPTTVEGAIDASIGGKNAINLGGTKNVVGAFHQPSLVVIDPASFRTLSARDVRAGLAESVKHALISSESFFGWHEGNAASLAALHAPIVDELLLRNIEVKARFVERDVRDRTGERAALNFGHTIGHALEAACDYRLRHGECVGLGMIAALRLSRARGMIDDTLVARATEVIGALGLPTRLDVTVDASRVRQAMLLDKKHEGERLRFVLVEGVGRPVVVGDVSMEEALRACASLGA